MKKVIAILILLVAVSAQADNLALWGLTSDGADEFIAARLGLERDQVEVGASVRWLTREPWNEDVDLAGAYIVFTPDITVEVQDPSPNNIFGDVIGLLIGRPYIGVEGLIPTHGHDRGVKVNWLAGTLISLDPEMKTALVVEYATGQAITDEDDNIISIGARIRF